MGCVSDWKAGGAREAGTGGEVFIDCVLNGREMVALGNSVDIVAHLIILQNSSSRYQKTKKVILRGVSVASGKAIQLSGNLAQFADVEVVNE